jgi:beta-glucosidase
VKPGIPDLLQKAVAIEGYEARYIFQSEDLRTTNSRGEGHRREGIVVRAPNADLARDPRWGRSEESYAEDPYLTGTMTVTFVRGLQGDDPHYWLTASLMKQFLANSNEDGRGGSSSDFDERLLRIGRFSPSTSRVNRPFPVCDPAITDGDPPSGLIAGSL